MTAVPASPEPTNPSLNIYLPAFSGGVAGGWAGAGLGNVLENIFHIQLLLFSFIVLLKRKLDWRWKGAPQLNPEWEDIDIDSYTDIFDH